jgi:hypothetical protein
MAVCLRLSTICELPEGREEGDEGGGEASALQFFIGTSSPSDHVCIK